VLLLPGDLKRLTVAHYLQALVSRAMPQDSAIGVLLQVFHEVPSVEVHVAVLAAASALALWAAARAVGQREYVLEQESTGIRLNAWSHMAPKTRFFVIASLLVLVVGLGTGLVAYYVGFPGVPGLGAGGPAEIRYVPRDVSLVAYANVRDVMLSDAGRILRQRAFSAQGRREFQDETGINVETDVDSVVGCVAPPVAGSSALSSGGGMVLARGRFNEVKVESVLREHGVRVEAYRNHRLLLGQDPASARAPGGPREHEAGTPVGSWRDREFALVFLEPGLAAVGSPEIVRKAIDLKAGVGESVTANDQLIREISTLDRGNVWAVGRMDALGARAPLPQPVAAELPAITWVAATGHIDGGIRGVVRADARDEKAANDLRDALRGLLVLGRMQASSHPELQPLLQSLELGASGRTVSLSFDLPAQALDAFASQAGDNRGR
jgi:hypothetical protein